MLRLIEDPEMVGGTVLEVGYKSIRKVMLLNDPGPSGEGLGASNVPQVLEEVFVNLAREGWGTLPP